MEKQTNGRANRWIATAAEEIRQIQKRWKFTSVRQFSKFLLMDQRTLYKLKNLDGSLTLESIAKIYSRLMSLRCVKFPLEMMKEEELRLNYSLMKIMMSVEPLPKSIQDIVQDELEHQL